MGVKVKPEVREMVMNGILQKPQKGIPIFLINPMEWKMIDRIAGMPEGSYEKDPVPVYRRMQENAGVQLMDQWIPENPLSMGSSGYEDSTARSATTGAESVVVNGIEIREPEDVIRHMEEHVFPALEETINSFDPAVHVEEIADSLIEKENKIQDVIGDKMLKVPYACATFPYFRYGAYGYQNYFMAYALYPEVMERDFKLQSQRAHQHNMGVAHAFEKGSVPPLIRLDHDMADGRSTLVDIKSLDEIWFPAFAHALQPLLKTDVRLIWHCDGNLMQMVPRLLDVGLCGFQGFQYEHGMDYEKICRMKTREGNPLLIVAGVSVTETLPHGTPDDVRKEMKWLVENGPETGLFLAGTSSITPGVPWENLEALIEGFHHYRDNGRG